MHLYHGRSDLTNAMHLYHGGIPAVAGQLGLEMTQDHLPDHHWKDLKVVERALLLWIDQHGTPGTMPTKAQLFVSGRADIAEGISKHHSGFKAVTAALGLIPGSNPPSVKPYAYWLEWGNVEAEMPAVSKACGAAEQMPTDRQLVANGYSSLTRAIYKHYGGLYKFAARLELPMQHKDAPANHFRDPPTLHAALLKVVVELGTGNAMPTQAQLQTHRRSDLANVIAEKKSRGHVIASSGW
jgi:hypothetical protein